MGTKTEAVRRPVAIPDRDYSTDSTSAQSDVRIIRVDTNGSYNAGCVCRKLHFWRRRDRGGNNEKAV